VKAPTSLLGLLAIGVMLAHPPAAAQAAPAAARPTLAVGEPDEQPVLATRDLARLINRAYPPSLKAHPVPGSADVHMLILATGRVDSASVSYETASSPAFGFAATQVARQLRFRPAKVGGRPVAVWVTYPIHFLAATDGTSTVTQHDPRMFPYHH
jgi:TonB family protein